MSTSEKITVTVSATINAPVQRVWDLWAIPQHIMHWNQLMHVALQITGGHFIMGTDAPESIGFKVNFGNNVYINIEPDTREETKRLFNALFYRRKS